MEPAGRSEQPSHVELIELPATIENINAKLNHLIVRTEVSIQVAERAERHAESARSAAERARDTAYRTGTAATKLYNTLDALPRRERIMAVAVGAVAGGAAMTFILRLAGALLAAAGVTSCLPGF